MVAILEEGVLTINHQMHITYGFSGSDSVPKKKPVKFPLNQPYCDSSGLECVDISLQELNAYFAILSDVEETLSESQFFPDITRVSQFSDDFYPVYIFLRKDLNSL